MDIYEMYINGMSTVDISKVCNMSKSTIRRRLKERGILRSLKESINLAESQGKIDHSKCGKYKRTEETKNKLRISRLSKPKKGYSLKPSGYYEITFGRWKFMSLHRAKIEVYLGRKLDKNEVVHHINGIKTDNRLINLSVMNLKDHSRLHALQNYKNIKRNNLGQFTI